MWGSCCLCRVLLGEVRGRTVSECLGRDGDGIMLGVRLLHGLLDEGAAEGRREKEMFIKSLYKYQSVFQKKKKELNVSVSV